MTMSIYSKRRRVVFLVVVVAGLALAACGGTATPHNQASGGTSPSSTSALSPYPGVDPGHVVPAPPGPTTTPTEDARYPIYKGFNTGQQALITAHGFEPEQLNAITGQAVVWTNMSGSPQQVVITQEGVRSPTIPPGAQFVWTWKSGGNINVRSASGFSQSLYYQQ
jgi:plastocyanin